MSRRQDDDLDELLSDLSGTLSELQDVLAEEEYQGRTRRPRRLPSPSRFLRFTEEHTIPTLISLLETNIRALKLFQGLLRLVNGRDSGHPSDSEPLRDDRRVRRTGQRTLDTLDSALSDLQGALEGEPTDSEARTLLDDARSLREEIDARIAGHDSKRNRSHSDERDRDQNQNQNRDRAQEDDGVITIDVKDPDADDGDETTDNGANNDNSTSTSTEVNVDDELDTIKRELQDDDDQDDDDQEED